MADESAERLSPAKRDLLRRLRAEAGARRLGDAPVAILGVALRLPGAPDRAAYWRLLADGRDAITEVPPTRWAVDELPARWGGFLDDIDQFDAGLFSISPREAETLDPQHRLLLETSVLALEDAGIARPSLAGSATGVFVACYQRDYAKLASLDPARIDAYTASGTHHSMVAGRLAYEHDLHGPALVVDTACSSSLVALHLACRSLLAGESKLALVGASNLMLMPEETLALSRWGMMAADGRCKPFDARADGFVRGEGVVVLVLARLQDAIAEGRRIRAVVLGTAVNQDGRSNGLTAPNARAQAEVIRAALRDATLEPGEVGYIEAHGTGTSLGDPIEMQALIECYGAPSQQAGVCAIGSVKSNIGHLEASAGLAGVAKAVACLEQREIPATLHLRQLNPAIDLVGTRLAVANEHRGWPMTASGSRCAGVSSFGMGGTNAHVILREAPPPSVATPVERSACVLPLSAHDPAALSELLERTRERLAECDDVHGYCASAARGRTHHARARVAVVGADTAELRAALAERETVTKPRQRPRGVVFCCPGQGGQWPGMGRGLLAREPVFAATLAACDAAIAPLAGWSVIELLERGAAAELERIDRIQPVLFALAIGYAALWRSFGLEPDAVIGHSMGEVAAAVIAGHLSLDDGARVIVRRSALMHTLPGLGSMVAVDLAAGELGERIAGQAAADALSVAAENGPSSSVLAGPRERVEPLIATLEAQGVRCRRIAVDVASHSPAVEALDEALAEALAQLSPQPGTLSFYSTVEGRRLGDHEPLDRDYWRRNLRQTVRLWTSVQAAAADRHELFIELGPHPVLAPALREGLDTLGVRGWTGACGRREADEQRELCNSLASLYEAGAELDWARIYAGARTDAVLPSYPFQRRGYWLPSPRRHAARGPHPFLGQRIELPREGVAPLRVWTRSVTLDDAPFLRDHLVEGSCVLPGMGGVDLVLSAVHEAGLAAAQLHDIVFERPIVFAENQPTELQLRVEPDAFELWARTGADGEREWIRRARGRLAALQAPGQDLDVRTSLARAHTTHDHASFYAALNRTGNVWGPAFAGVQRIASEGEELFVELAIPPSIVAELWRHRFHPALLDACAQAMLSGQLDDHGSLVLARIDRIAIHGAAERVHASWIRLDREQHGGSLRGDVIVVDEQGARLVEIEGLRVQFIHEQQASWFHRVAWRPLEVSTSDTLPRALAVVGRGSSIIAALEQALVSRGLTCVEPEQASDAVWMADAVFDPSAPDRTLDELVRACIELMQLTRVARLWVVTCGATGSLQDPVHAALWGFAKVLGVELGRRFMGAIDLDPALGPELAAARLLDELSRSDNERQVALRVGDRLVARLDRQILARSSSSPLARLDPGASYLISGGLGGLGRRMAAHLVDRGARRLILASRTGLPARERWSTLAPDDPLSLQVADVLALEARGVEVHCPVLDVADQCSLRELADHWRAQRRPAIRGIVHAAGVQHPRTIAELDETALREDLRAKVAGVVALDQVWGESLDWMLLFSSAATLMPSPLLGAYTAANAFLDGFAERARAQGREVCAVAWGLIGSGGMAQRHTTARGSQGLSGAFVDMDAGEAFIALDRVLAAELGSVGVMAIDWPSWLGDHADAAASPYYEALRSGTAVLEHVDTSIVELRGLDRAARREQLEVHLRRGLARVLRASDPSGQGIDADVPLTTLGIDSLMALELRNRIEAETGAAPPVVELLRGISLVRLIELVASLLDDAPAGPLPADDQDWEEFTI